MPGREAGPPAPQWRPPSLPSGQPEKKKLAGPTILPARRNPGCPRVESVWMKKEHDRARKGNPTNAVADATLFPQPIIPPPAAMRQLPCLRLLKLSRPCRGPFDPAIHHLRKELALARKMGCAGSAPRNNMLETILNLARLWTQSRLLPSPRFPACSRRRARTAILSSSVHSALLGPALIISRWRARRWPRSPPCRPSMTSTHRCLLPAGTNDPADLQDLGAWPRDRLGQPGGGRQSRAFSTICTTKPRRLPRPSRLEALAFGLISRSFREPGARSSRLVLPETHPSTINTPYAQAHGPRTIPRPARPLYFPVMGGGPLLAGKARARPALIETAKTYALKLPRHAGRRKTRGSGAPDLEEVPGAGPAPGETRSVCRPTASTCADVVPGPREGEKTPTKLIKSVVAVDDGAPGRETTSPCLGPGTCSWATTCTGSCRGPSASGAGPINHPHPHTQHPPPGVGLRGPRGQEAPRNRTPRPHRRCVALWRERRPPVRPDKNPKSRGWFVALVEHLRKCDKLISPPRVYPESQHSNNRPIPGYTADWCFPPEIRNPPKRTLLLLRMARFSWLVSNEALKRACGRRL